MRKPLHKHIGHHAKKFHGHFTKYLYERDTIFATIWVFVFIFGLVLIPLNLGILNPIKLGLKDFDFNDIYYSKSKNTDSIKLDNRITIINTGYEDREGIARMIDMVAQYKPKVMGLDFLFDGPREPAKDSILRETIEKNKNLVLAVQFQLDTAGKFMTAKNYFKTDSTLFGYANFPTKGDQETIRTYFPFKKNKEISLPSFTSSLIKLYNTEAYKKIEKKGDKQILINYTRKYNEETKDKNKKYWVVDDLLNTPIDESLIKDRIVLFAYVNTNPNDIEDKKFTPMNEKFAGKSWPDMNGIVVHANIISMVLDDNYIKKVPLWANFLIAVLVCWLFMSFFIRYYLESHIWFHLVAKIVQVFSAILFIWLGIIIFERYRLKVDLKLSIIVIIMAVDVIYFYEAWAVWMHKKYKFKTVFKPHHH
jgi:CHASE2 domain-containing sensor protein